MKKFVLMIMAAAFTMALSSCNKCGNNQKKKNNNYNKKQSSRYYQGERVHRRW